jgi:hypothetical protein
VIPTLPRSGAPRERTTRKYRDSNDWSNAAIVAARLDMGSETASRISANISKYQVYACGLASWDTSKLNEPYIGQVGAIAALNEAAATDFDGIIRLASALPSGWSSSGTVYVQGQSRVQVQFQSVALAFGVLESGSSGTAKIKNPWGTTQAAIIDSATQQAVTTTGDPMSFSAQTGHAYLIRKASDANLSVVDVTGTAASAPKRLGSRTIGIEGSPLAAKAVRIPSHAGPYALAPTHSRALSITILTSPRQFQ